MPGAAAASPTRGDGTGVGTTSGTRNVRSLNAGTGADAAKSSSPASDATEPTDSSSALAQSSQQAGSSGASKSSGAASASASASGGKAGAYKFDASNERLTSSSGFSVPMTQSQYNRAKGSLNDPTVSSSAKNLVKLGQEDPEEFSSTMKNAASGNASAFLASVSSGASSSTSSGSSGSSAKSVKDQKYSLEGTDRSEFYNTMDAAGIDNMYTDNGADDDAAAQAKKAKQGAKSGAKASVGAGAAAGGGKGAGTGMTAGAGTETGAGTISQSVVVGGGGGTAKSTTMGLTAGGGTATSTSSSKLSANVASGSAATSAGTPTLSSSSKLSASVASGSAATSAGGGNTLMARVDSGDASTGVDTGAGTYTGAATSIGGSLGATGGLTGMELVQMVMLQASSEAESAAEDLANTVQRNTSQKDALRIQVDGLQNSLFQLQDSNQVTYDNSGAMTGTAGEYNLEITNMSSQMDSIGDDNQLLFIRLQNYSQQLTTTMQATSNISKSLFDTEKAIVGQIGH